MSYKASTIYFGINGHQNKNSVQLYYFANHIESLKHFILAISSKMNHRCLLIHAI